MIQSFLSNILVSLQAVGLVFIENNTPLACDVVKNIKVRILNHFEMIIDL